MKMEVIFTKFLPLAIIVSFILSIMPAVCANGLPEPVWEGSGYTFSGSSGIKASSNIGIYGNQPFSITVLLTPGTNAKDEYGNGIIGWGNASKNAGNFIYYNSAEKAFEYGFYANDGQTPSEFEPNRTYFIVMTYDGTRQKFYVDGKLITQRAVRELSIANTPLTIGSDPFGQGRNFYGSIDSIKVYNAAIDEDTVLQLANAQKPQFPTPLKDAYYNGAKITSPFWKAQIKKMAEKWIPHCIAQLEEVYYGIDAFRQAAKKLRGEDYINYEENLWANAYVYNTMEAMCLALTIDPDGDEEFKKAQDYLRQKLEEWIPIVLSAQEPDGYINTMYTVRGWQRWTNKTHHEGYVMGYFIEAALAHYQMTNMQDSRLYDAAVKCADLWVNTIGPAPKKFWYDGHQGMEMALMHLGQFINEHEGEGLGDKYIELAEFLCDARGNDQEYDQSHLSSTEQSEAKGHAVRATYLYSAMADIAMQNNNSAYYYAVQRLWDSVVNHKMYITGGVGSIASNEGFSSDYYLPNKSYDESCASCGMVFWSNRMNNAFHDAEYIDGLERQFYNVVAGAVNLEGDAFYYQNELDANWARYSWHGCPCCVGNIPRTILNLVKWMYSTEDDHTLYVNMLAGSDVTVTLGDNEIQLIQESNYPWEGYGKITVIPKE